MVMGPGLTLNQRLLSSGAGVEPVVLIGAKTETPHLVPCRRAGRSQRVKFRGTSDLSRSRGRVRAVKTLFQKMGHSREPLQAGDRAPSVRRLLANRQGFDL